ncbi:Zn(2)-Cys(6) binuclear cluster domain-containing protein [Mycena latifolia]|nr:Zn(2)-Cys(6) binuclear cluster domain-containing protein [Mycena latifolia]
MNQASFSVNVVTPLQKGKACVNCRRRKIKCDSAKPICTPCARYATAFGDCEYTENGPSQSEMLEGEQSKQIGILQARISELEKPKQLHASPLLPKSSKGPRNTASTRQISPSNTMGLGPLLSYFYLQQTSGSSVNSAAAKSMPTELPFIVLQALVHNFLHNASCFGFFLDTQAFHNAITSPHGRNLPPVLLNVMYLWGIHLSEDARITAYEPAFLAHALRSTAGSLAGTHPRTVLHSMQASVLLAYYFVRNARFLEAKYHTSVAVSIAVSAGLHRIRGHAPPTESALGVEALRAPRDAKEEGERISAFWRVLNLNNCWAGVDGAPSNVSYGSAGLTIDTPWPLETRDYVERPHLLPGKSSGTVAKFLADVPDDARSGPALHAKAGILFEEAARLGARFRASGTPPSDSDAEVRALDSRIDAFKPALPAIHCKGMLVVHMLAHGATIQLHGPRASGHIASRAKALVAARATVDILSNIDVPKIGLIDPVLAPLWTSTCLVFLAELERERPRPRGQQETAHAKSLKAALGTVIATMEVFAPHCRLMTAQLDAVRNAQKARSTY